MSTVRYTLVAVRWWFTDHAIERYAQRVRPALTRAQARHELMRIVEHGEIAHARPAWLRYHGTADGYLLVADVCFPLRRRGNRWIALTCLTRGSLTPHERRERSELHRARRQAARRKPPAGRILKVEEQPHAF
jgi:hypothetical protein